MCYFFGEKLQPKCLHFDQVWGTASKNPMVGKVCPRSKLEICRAQLRRPPSSASRINVFTHPLPAIFEKKNFRSLQQPNLFIWYMCIPSKRVQYQTQVIVVQVSFPISPGRFLGIHTTKMRHASIYLTVFWSQDQTSCKIAENTFPSPSCSQLMAVSQSWISSFLFKMDTFHCSKTIQEYWILQMYIAYSSPKKKCSHLLFPSYSFIFANNSSHQTIRSQIRRIFSRPQPTEPWSKNPNACRHMSAWSIHPLHQFVQCHSSDLSNVQNNRMAGPGLWEMLNKAFCWSGIDLTLMPLFFVGQRPILQNIHSKEANRKMFKKKWMVHCKNVQPLF